MKNQILYIILLLIMVSPMTIEAQRKKKKDKNQNQVRYQEEFFKSLKWRSIGPFRGGRSAAITGVPNQPNLYYFGATGGGVWRTQDGGQTWKNISDGYFGGSIGAVAVSEYDNNVIYVGGGEVTVRGNVSYGYGMYKSVDAGKTWQHIGLKKSRHIPRIRIHPKNPDLVYAAVLGDLYKSSEERGVYRSKDGGKTWERILFANANAGAVDLILDPNNSRVIYASTWRIRRTPYDLSSGGKGSTLWKSTDGGDTWKDISSNTGLPKGTRGIIGIAVSPVKRDRVWIIMEHQKGGIFRSENGGKTWKKINSERSMRQRAWYYTRIYADTKDEDIVYVLNVRYFKSKDGGKTFKAYMSPHSDHHDLWIAPENNQRMAIADDGGGQVSFDGGNNWSTYLNQPTAQFYRVTTDNHFPYRIYGAQQDNSTVRIAHRSSGRSIGERDWQPTAGGESAHIAISPEDNDVVYGGSYDGYLTRINHKTQEIRAVNVWPDNPMGHGAEGMKYRFQWNFPIFFSPHDNKKLYTASQHLHVTRNDGESWEIISPDLTRNDSTKLGPSGGPITKDNTSVEYYCTIFAAAESHREKDVIWAGSDDGLIHVTKDGGKNWNNVTPKNIPEWIMINSIEIDPFVDGGLYVAATMYKWGDYRPYLYKTKDYGKTWTKITNGIDNEHFTRVIRADPKRKGLLYAGTETGMYVSFDDGENWQSFQLNLPIVPITDLAIKNDNLIAATQGRSFWMIDDLTVLHQLNDKLAQQPIILYQPMPAYRMRGSQNPTPRNEGINHAGGVMIHYYLGKYHKKKDTVSISIYEQDGDLIRTFSTHAKEKKDKLKINEKEKAQTFRWNMRYPDAASFKGMINWAGSVAGPTAVPGDFKVQLSVNRQTQEQSFKILKDPRSSSTIADLQAQFDFLQGVGKKLTETHKTITKIRQVRNQVKGFAKRLKDKAEYEDIVKMAQQIDSSITAIEKTLYQTKNQSRQDPLNFPIRLNNKLAHLNSLMRMGDFRPTKQAIAVRKALTDLIDVELAKFKRIVKEDLKAFNALVKEKGVDAVVLED